MQRIFVTEDVSKLDGRVKEGSSVILNIQLISVTNEVLKLSERVKEVMAPKPWNKSLLSSLAYNVLPSA